MRVNASKAIACLAGGSGWLAGGGALGAYLVLAVVMTWPLALGPGRLGVPNMDVYGNAWAMAWVDHQLARAPLELFESNMFYPWTHSLAYAESLIPQALQALPVRALGGSPLLAYNVVFLWTFGLSGLGAYLFAAELSESRAAGFLAGLSFAFCAYRWDHVVHLQSLSIQWLPFALWFARRALRSGRTVDLAGMGICSLLQVLSSGYYAMLVLIALAIVGFWEWRNGASARHAGRAMTVLAAAIVVALPVFAVHRSIQARHGFSRGRLEAVAWSARPASYLEPGVYVGLPHLVALGRLTRDGEALFPGSWAVAVGALALARLGRERSVTAPACLLGVGFLLSLGPVLDFRIGTIPGPFDLFRLLPGGHLLRTPSRLGVLAVLALDVLAATAWARVWRSRRQRIAASALAAGLIAIEAFPVGLSGAIREIPERAPVAAWLASAERGVVLELPWQSPEDSAQYLYWSTHHWQPMVNGFGSFDPPGNFGVGLLGNRWPSEFSARSFRAYGVRYVVVHLDRVKDAQRRRIEAADLPAGVRLAATLGETRIYEISGTGTEKPHP